MTIPSRCKKTLTRRAPYRGYSAEYSIYAWRKKFGDMGTDDVKRLKQLEQEKEIAVKKW
jgi:hypothetical protein